MFLNKQVGMQEDGTMKYYLHSDQYFHSERGLASSYGFSQEGERYNGVAIANFSHLEMYQILGASINYHRTYKFQANISVLQTIPLKNQPADLLFLADHLGRFQFWTICGGSLLVDNKVRSSRSPVTFYRDIQNNQQVTQYHGIHYVYDVNDTKGFVFFTVDEKLVHISFVVRKGKLKILDYVSEFVIPYPDVVYVGVMDNVSGQVGLIEQREQRTFLHVHNLSNFQCLWSLDRLNLVSFISVKHQLVLQTQQEICTVREKSGEQLSCFKISYSGFVSRLDEDKFIYLSDNASEMIVFSRKKYKNYGSFHLENQVCLELRTHGMLPDGGYLISVVDEGHTMEFLGVYEDGWKPIRSISGVSSIFMLQELKNRSCLTVTKVSDSFHQVGILSNTQGCKLEKKTVCQPTITNIFVALRGEYILVCKTNLNMLYRYDLAAQEYSFICELFEGRILLVTDHHLVTDRKIFSINFHQQTIKEILEDDAEIVHAICDGTYIGFYAKNCSYKYLNLETVKIDRIKRDCYSQYLWNFHAKEEVIIADYQRPGEIIYQPIFKKKSFIPTQCEDQIVSMESMGELLLISFISAKIHVFSFDSMTIIHQVNGISEPLNLVPCSSAFLAFGTTQSFYLQIQPSHCQMKPIEFDPSEDLRILNYLPEIEKIIIVTNTHISLYNPPLDQKPDHPHFRIISVQEIQNEENNPFALTNTEENIVYIASAYEIMMRDIRSGEILKKQSHILKQIQSVERMEEGILVGGANDMEYGEIILFSFDDLEILCTIQTQDKIPLSMKRVTENTFAVRSNCYVMMYELVKKNLAKEKLVSKVSLQGYTLAINPSHHLTILSDPLKYLVAYDYRHSTLTSLCRHGNNNMINDFEFIDDAVVCGDAGGFAQILEFDLEGDEISRTFMTSVGGINVGEEIMLVSKGQDGVVYATMSGFVGKFTSISSEEFIFLKQAEKYTFEQVQNSNSFKYSLWRQRTSLNDKIIDSFLIEKFMETQIAHPTFPKVKNIMEKISKNI